MLTPEELKLKIEHTTLPEAITLFKEKVLKKAYQGIYLLTDKK